MILPLLCATLSCSSFRRQPASLESTEHLIEDVPTAASKAQEMPPSAETSPTSAPTHTREALENNEAVAKWIRYFTERDRERFQRFLARGVFYRDIVEDVLEDNGLPRGLYYLAMIESGYHTRARSHAKAVGVWQFIQGTAVRYGLRVDRDVDERQDPIRATEAAARYLRDLHNVFGSWHLAIAAYNAGEYRILSAVMRGKSRDFWELAEKKVLPQETANYVPKFLAALLIGENPQRYGFVLDDEGEKYPNLVSLELPSPVRLSDVAQLSGLSLSELKHVNPHIRRGITPTALSSYELWIPENGKDQVESVRHALARKRLRGRRIRVAQSSSNHYFHKVRRGENLSAIARKYKTSVAYLKKINGLKSSRIYPGSKLRVTTRSYHASARKYRVRRGDSLTAISRKYGTSVHAIKKANGLKRDSIRVGQWLRVPENVSSL